MYSSRMLTVRSLLYGRTYVRGGGLPDRDPLDRDPPPPNQCLYASIHWTEIPLDRPPRQRPPGQRLP